MPSNAEYTSQAEALATELVELMGEEAAAEFMGETIKQFGDDFKPEKPNNEQLAKMVSDLKAKKKELQTDTDTPDAAAKAAAEAKEEATAAAEAKAKEEAQKKPPFYVADGKSLTCKKGVLDSGEEVKAAYLGGGKDSLAALVKSGHVIKS